MTFKNYCWSSNFWLAKFMKLINTLQFSSFCCIANLQQGTLLIAVIELSLTSFVLFLLLLGVTHIQEIVGLVSVDLQELEQNNWSLGHLERLSWYFTNNERKMISGQQLASLMMVLVYSGLIITSIHFISCLLLFYGAYKKLSQYLLPWIWTHLLSIVSGCFFLFLLFFLPIQQCKFGTYASGIFLIALEMYAWLIVFSYYMEIKS